MSRARQIRSYLLYRVLRVERRPQHLVAECPYLAAVFRVDHFRRCCHGAIHAPSIASLSSGHLGVLLAARPPPNRAGRARLDRACL